MANPASLPYPPTPQGFVINADLERDIWQKGFNSLAAAAAGGGASGGASVGSKIKASLDCRNYSLLLTEPLFNFDSVRALTEEVRRTCRMRVVYRVQMFTTSGLLGYTWTPYRLYREMHECMKLGRMGSCCNSNLGDTW